ncbi:MAG: response regulator transcription factor [Synechococcales cyanobacterium M58_A2018_015]|nr:response regulator transcription factor [Synechococcales cyanobacterium M58_A2018_015]
MVLTNDIPMTSQYIKSRHNHSICLARTSSYLEPLTAREKEVLELIVAGYSNLDIAKQLMISVGTVKSHVRNLMNKMAANSRTQLAVQALRLGLVL